MTDPDLIRFLDDQDQIYQQLLKEVAAGRNETHLHVTYATHLDMDDAFCASMRIAIAAGLESAPVGVVTTPGTKNPRYLPTEHCPLVPAPGEWTF